MPARSACLRSFQFTAARRRLRGGLTRLLSPVTFQFTAARRRLRGSATLKPVSTTVSIHSRPKAAARSAQSAPTPLRVSIHSRPKAAAKPTAATERFWPSFNSQPPEGGCSLHQNPRRISQIQLLFRQPVPTAESVASIAPAFRAIQAYK